VTSISIEQEEVTNKSHQMRGSGKQEEQQTEEEMRGGGK